MKKIILKFAPVWMQNLAISIYNSWGYRKKRQGDYSKYRAYFTRTESWSCDEIREEQKRLLKQFLKHAVENSKWYEDHKGLLELNQFPILNKEDVVHNLDDISTISDGEGKNSQTGGTTGASMRVRYTHSNAQERQAVLDLFRESFGYEYGRSCAWFSGKSFVREKDLTNGLFWRKNYFNRIRFYSTFHVNQDNFDAYWEGLEEQQPEFMVGFPSTISEICRIAQMRGLKYSGKVKAYFPTAEMMLPDARRLIEETFGCRVADQYASSEGAHFILECKCKKLHIQPLTGVFEVVDDDLKPAFEGEILVTSFTTYGTPLIRYRIGDRITLDTSGENCECGSAFPIVKRLEGRNLDYIHSLENGRVNQGNLSNCTKDVIGIVEFQIVQNHEDELDVNIVITDEFDDKQRQKFLTQLRERVGMKMKVNLREVDSIPRKKSGKFQFVENNLQ